MRYTDSLCKDALLSHIYREQSLTRWASVPSGEFFLDEPLKFLLALQWTQASELERGGR